MSLTQTVIELLTQEGLKPIPVDTQAPSVAEQERIHNFRFNIQSHEYEWMCVVRVFEQSQRVLIYSIFPKHAQPAQINRIALLLAKINYGLVLGNFEMDIDDGEIRYKTSIDLEGLTLNQTALRNLLYGNFFTVNQYYQVLDQAVEGHADPVKLVEQLEQHEPSHALDLVDEHIH